MHSTIGTRIMAKSGTSLSNLLDLYSSLSISIGMRSYLRSNAIETSRKYNANVIIQPNRYASISRLYLKNSLYIWLGVINVTAATGKLTKLSGCAPVYNFSGPIGPSPRRAYISAALQNVKSRILNFDCLV